MRIADILDLVSPGSLLIAIMLVRNIDWSVYVSVHISNAKTQCAVLNSHILIPLKTAEIEIQSSCNVIIEYH